MNDMTKRHEAMVNIGIHIPCIGRTNEWHLRHREAKLRIRLIYPPISLSLLFIVVIVDAILVFIPSDDDDDDDDVDDDDDEDHDGVVSSCLII